MLHRRNTFQRYGAEAIHPERDQSTGTIFERVHGFSIAVVLILIVNDDVLLMIPMV